MKKLGILTVISILFLISSAFAFEVDVPADNVVNQGDTAYFTFTIRSPSDSIYLLSTSASNANWLSMPSRVEIRGAETQFTVVISAPRNALPTKHGFPIRITSFSNNNNFLEETIYLTVRPKDGIEIEEMTPLLGNYRQDEVVSMNVKLNSDEPLPREVDIIFNIKSPSGEVIKTTSVHTIVPADKTTQFNQPFRFENDLAPGKYTVTATVKDAKKEYGTFEGNFEVTPLANIVKKKNAQWTFLAIKSVIEIQNTGNAPTQNIEVRDSIPAFWSLFVRDTNAEVVSEGSDKMFTWRLAQVDPKTSQSVSYSIILWPIYLIVLAAGFLGFKGYTTFLVPSVSKDFTSKVNLGEGKEGSVVIHAKNKGLTTLQHVVINDHIPSSFKIVDASVPRPKYKKAAHGSMLRWELGTLAPGEERVFSYKIKNMMGIIGTVSLPKAEMNANGKTYKSKSLKTTGDVAKQHI